MNGYISEGSETFNIAGKKYRGRRDMSKPEVIVACSMMPKVNVDDVITQEFPNGKTLEFKVTDFRFEEGANLYSERVNLNPHNLILVVENIKDQPRVIKPVDSTVNIGSINAGNVQVGNSNILTTNITIHELVENIVKSNDPEAKSKLKELLQNSTAASLIGAGASALLNMLM